MILEEIKEYDKDYIIESYSKKRMNEFELYEIERLNKFQQYELRLNQDFMYLNNYEALKETIFSNNWGDLNYFNISNIEIVNYIEKKLTHKLSIDRVYFFNEMMLYFCEQSKKKETAISTLNSLKLSINDKLKDNNYNYDLLVTLSTRFIIISNIYKIDEKEYIEKIICNKLLINFNLNDDFLTLLGFYKFIFKEYDKKMPYFSILLEKLNFFSDSASTIFSNLLYEPSNHCFSLIAKIYKLKNISDKNKMLIYYRKEIDNALIKMKDMTIGEAFRLQNIIYKILKISKDIKYKTKEVQLLVKKNADIIKNNSDKIFNHINIDDSIEKNLEKAYKLLKEYFLKIVDYDEKIDYLILYELYSYFSSNQYKSFKEKQKDSDHTFVKAFFPTASRVSHQGISYTIKDPDLFEFFNHNVVFFNNLFLNLDYEHKWIQISNKTLFEKIENIQILAEYEEQYKTALLLFEEEKYIEFMYISPGLIENILKQFLYKINGEVFSSRTEPMEKTLNQILIELIDDDDCYMDKYFLHYINFILVDNTGLNLRNDILHGNYRDGYFNKSNAMYLYVILVFLIRYFLYDQDLNINNQIEDIN